MSIYGGVLGVGMMATSPWELAPADIWAEVGPSGHHYEVWLGLLWIIFMYNLSMYGASWGWGW